MFQFILTIRQNGNTLYQNVLSPKKKSKALQTWNWDFPAEQATYHALYPRSWTIYNIPKFSVKLTCQQISPIFPHDYRVSLKYHILIVLSNTFLFKYLLSPQYW